MRRFLRYLASLFRSNKPTPPPTKPRGARIVDADKWHAANERARQAEEECKARACTYTERNVYARAAYTYTKGIVYVYD